MLENARVGMEGAFGKDEKGSEDWEGLFYPDWKNSHLHIEKVTETSISDVSPIGPSETSEMERKCKYLHCNTNDFKSYKICTDEMLFLEFETNIEGINKK